MQTYTGSEAMYQMLKAIFPSIARLPNHLPPNAGITTSGMLCYLLYWLFQLPFLLVSPQKIRWLFTVKAVVVPAAWLAMLIWACVKVPLGTPGGFFEQSAAVHGPALSWAWLSGLNSVIGLYATLAVNIPDFTRYARTERAQYVQLAIIPVAFTLAGFVGLAVTSAGVTLYGAVLWDPMHLIDVRVRLQVRPSPC
jgi:nucleobase:cation symporter-1, NCS1 family